MNFLEFVGLFVVLPVIYYVVVAIIPRTSVVLALGYGATWGLGIIDMTTPEPASIFDVFAGFILLICLLLVFVADLATLSERDPGDVKRVFGF